MIKRTLITALVLVLGYHFILPHLSRNYFWIPGQQRANYLRAQQFVHDSPPSANVVVGSSMSNELNEEILGKGFVKLTFPAGGSFTGLDIIHQTGKQPPVLFIESNTLLRDTDKSLADDATSPWRRKLRDASPVFKEEGRPSNYEVGFLNAWVGRIFHGVTKVLNGGKKAEPAAEQPLDASVMENVMRANREHLGRPPSESDLAARTKRLGDIVDALTRAGTKCVFFEMPIDPTLMELAEPVAVRKAMASRFPEDQYTWLRFDFDSAYQTSDGIHLVKADADKVTRKILEKADSLK
ncbi:MAG: hypothetical protein ABIS50_00020 [Luteolibacter sp.]|uniref:hypothetical protein n=1 Tax=Luteolibacter sp. TaxID=1962973 RepID=UPI0032675747